MASDDDDRIRNHAVLRAMEVHLGASKQLQQRRDQIAAGSAGRQPSVASTDTKRLDRAFRSLVTAEHEGRSVAAVLRELRTRIGDIPEVARITEERMVFFRVRKNVDPTVEDIDKPATFGYPPSLSTPRGRANLTSLPVLYCAFSTKTAFAEAAATPSDRIHLAIYEKPSPVPIAMSICLFDDISQDHPFSIWARRGEEYFGNQVGSARDHREAILHARKLLSRLFLQENYGISARLASYNLYHAGFDAIVYPSVANSSDCNIAMHPDFSDRALRLWRVYEMSVEKGWDTHFFLRRGLPVDNALKWEDCGGGNDQELRRFVRGS